ncbi:NYN domain-containing protein [Bradyrhizobium elkanii]|uniref:Uncharacterized LabA/DUF88 family protein n=1 Tax=Bradyrhizobium elkanii TaxID=29448 RepID=A0ABV4EXF6_BRAEL|nr:NYN domain-containing protein [Bradyrhizobium elkanii]MCP1756873.1 uncharacterized LabA/DUF88 family protein [Bradyrhizobium elkanii]MCP1982386.1 uncharacterized LabA/DUF88 family protein [Bradyrhizobium elkanii]MCS3882830.1 uncharacterized LabA/DUF88 family protein [Bradyrhizobium elkanii]MCS4218113.1 uncharacterized LabA/DUF88 family protein [Bradyrhizobium elkanii]MCW2195437.1 uncharacterized LabA/DUF88 family protein [Bradyrhizobium elkanii]
MTNRIALSIHDANLHTTVKSLGFEVDFRRLLAEFGKYGLIVCAYFYTVVTDDDEFRSIRPPADWLDTTGIRSGESRPKEHSDGEEVKRSVGVAIAADALEIARQIDHTFLFSGDGDLRSVVEAVKRMGGPGHRRFQYSNETSDGRR